jgi:predicted secreted hydrolase
MEHLYLAHFAITDIAGKRFHYDQRMHRGALGLAGASESAGRIWAGDWKAEISDQSLSVRAASREFAVDLQLLPAKAAVLHGDAGISRKGPEPENFSHYYSFTRLRAEGSLESRGRRFAVNGNAWMDHEYSNSYLPAGHAGWDWFGLQLSDNTELMLFRMRRSDGTAGAHSAGTFVDERGVARRLAAVDFELLPAAGSEWQSPHSRARYPLKWRIRVPALQLELETEAAVDDQELNTAKTTAVTYWEGAVRARGRRQGAAITAEGYLEMTGYAGTGGLSVLRR